MKNAYSITECNSLLIHHLELEMTLGLSSVGSVLSLYECKGERQIGEGFENGIRGTDWVQTHLWSLAANGSKKLEVWVKW